MARGALTAVREDVIIAKGKLAQDSADAIASKEITLKIVPALRQVARILFFQYQFNELDAELIAVNNWSYQIALGKTDLSAETVTLIHDDVLLFDSFAFWTYFVTSGSAGGQLHCVRELAPGRELLAINDSVWGYFNTANSSHTNEAFFRLGYQVLTLTEQQYLSAQVDSCC